SATSGGPGAGGGSGGAGVAFHAGATGGGGGGGDALGGAVYGGSLLFLINATLVGNSAIGGQGGAADRLFGQPGANGTGFGGGIAGLPGGHAVIRNSILANNSADQDPDYEDPGAAAGQLSTQGHNMFTSMQGFNPAASDFAVADPMLAPLG